MIPSEEVIDKILLVIMVVIIAMILSTVKTKAAGLDLRAHLGEPVIWVSIYENRSHGMLYYVDADGHITYKTSVSSGAKGFDTPNGNFKVYYKKRYHMSTKYPEASGINNMDYSLFFLNGFALHQGNPRQKSHGCIHVGRDVAPKLYADARHGMRVIVTRIPIKKHQKKKKRRLFQNKLNYILEDF